MTTSIYTQLAEAARAGEPAALAILTSTRGSTPQRTGAKAVFLGDGRMAGTLGGGCLEAEVQDRARRALRTGEATAFELVLDHDFGWDDGLICGGRVTVLVLPRASDAGPVWEALAAAARPGSDGDGPRAWGITEAFEVSLETTGTPVAWRYREEVRPPVSLWIAGSGHIARALAPMALELGFAVTVLDDRPALQDRAFFPEPITLRSGSWDDLLAEPWSGGPRFGTIMTRGHQRDAIVLRSWIRQPFDFLGMIGSRRKWRTISEALVEQGLARPDELARVASPLGIPIGAVSVPEIAVSVLAQLIEQRRRLDDHHAPGLPP